MNGLQSSPLEPTSAEESKRTPRSWKLSAVATLTVAGFLMLSTWSLTQHVVLPETLAHTVQKAITRFLTPVAPTQPGPVKVTAVIPSAPPDFPATATEWRRNPLDQNDRPTSSVEMHRIYGIGDKIKVNFYEKIVVEEDKWGRAGSALKSLQHRPELSGEFSVQEDGTISIPLIGSVSIADRTTAQIQADLAKAFQDLIGRRGMVSILSSERQPIYVIGPVKNPGSYKYVPNMTVLHSIALSGGLDSGASDPWQKIEAVRTIQKRYGAADAMLKLLARSAVLKSERDNTPVRAPSKLTEMVGAAEANSILAEQNDKRRALITARRNRELSITAAVESARQDVNLVFNRMGPLNELIKLRQDRVGAMKSLVDKSVLSKSVLNQVQSELMEADQRRVETLGQYTQVKQRLLSLEADSARVISDMRSDLETEIEMVDRQLAEQEREYTISEGVLSTLPVTRTQFAASKDANRKIFRVVRQTPNGPIELTATGMTVLQPGDLVNILLVNEAAEQPDPSNRTLVAPGGSDRAESAKASSQALQANRSKRGL